MSKIREATVQATAKLTSSGEPMSYSSVLNAVRAAAGPDYNTTIPMVDATNVNHYSRIISASEDLLDEFTRVLITKVVALYVKSASSWDSTLRQFHAGPMPKGIGIEVMARNLIPIKNWNEVKNGDHVGELFKDHGDNLVAQIQTIDELKYFPITVWQGELLYNSITTAEGLSAFIEDIFTQLRNSKEVYLYERIKKTIFDFATNPDAEKMTYELEEVKDEETAKTFLVEAQATLGDFQFFSNQHNLQGVDMHSKGKTPVLITTPRMKAHIDINALAAMFNLSKENVSQYILLVDELPEDVQAILTTDKFIQLYERIDKITEQYHPVLDRTNYFNLLQILVANNQFENARIFTKKKDDVVEPVDTRLADSLAQLRSITTLDFKEENDWDGLADLISNTERAIDRDEKDEDVIDYILGQNKLMWLNFELLDGRGYLYTMKVVRGNYFHTDHIAKGVVDVGRNVDILDELRWVYKEMNLPYTGDEELVFTSTMGDRKEFEFTEPLEEDKDYGLAISFIGVSRPDTPVYETTTIFSEKFTRYDVKLGESLVINIPEALQDKEVFPEFRVYATPQFVIDEELTPEFTISEDRKTLEFVYDGIRHIEVLGRQIIPVDDGDEGELVSAKALLQSKVDEALLLQEEHYLVSGWSDFTSVLTDAQELLNSGNEEPHDYYNKTSDLTMAMDSDHLPFYSGVGYDYKLNFKYGDYNAGHAEILRGVEYGMEVDIGELANGNYLVEVEGYSYDGLPEDLVITTKKGDRIEFDYKKEIVEGTERETLVLFKNGEEDLYEEMLPDKMLIVGNEETITLPAVMQGKTIEVSDELGIVESTVSEDGETVSFTYTGAPILNITSME